MTSGGIIRRLSLIQRPVYNLTPRHRYDTNYWLSSNYRPLEVSEINITTKNLILLVPVTGVEPATFALRIYNLVFPPCFIKLHYLP